MGRPVLSVDSRPALGKSGFQQCTLWQTKNETCRSAIDLELFLHCSLVPSVAIIVLLSCLERRVRRSAVDEKCWLLNRRCGIVIPLDFVGAFSNRWSLAFAFGATANKIMIMFSDGYLPQQVPRWAQALVLLVAAMEVGLSSYPFFACLSTAFQLTGATLGFLYTGAWFVAITMYIAHCPHGQIVGHYEKIIFYWPSLFCLLFLLIRFVHMFAKELWIRCRPNLQNAFAGFLLSNRQPYKSWMKRKVYEWDPYFRFPSRMICTAVLAIICLYMFIIIEFYVYKLVLNSLKTVEENFEMLVGSRNTSEIFLASVAQQLKEYIGVTEGVWIFTTFTACLTCIIYVFHILACYRKHMKRLWAGRKQFLPLESCKLSSSQSVAAIARYSGWQIAYILWGYLIIHMVQCLLGVMFMYTFVLPIKHGQGIDMLKSVGTGVLTLSIAIGLMGLQIVTAAVFFLQPKISSNDKEKPLAIDNRKAFHNFNYFLFFYNMVLGLSTCLVRLLCSIVVGAWLVARIDRSVMPRGFEAVDLGFRTWISMLFMDHYHTNPTLVYFCHILVAKNTEQEQLRGRSYHTFGNGTDLKGSKKARTRWLLLYTLLNNPSLSTLRKPQRQSRSAENSFA